MRMRPLLLIVPLLLVALGLPCGYAEPRTGWDLAARLPASCIAFVSLEDLHLMREKAEQTAFGKMMKDPAMQPFLAPLTKALEELADPKMLPPELKEALEQLRSVRGQLAVAFLGIDEAADGPLLVASIDFGPKVGEFGAFLERLAAQAGSQAVELTSETKEGRPRWTAKFRHGPTLTATTVDTTFVVSTSPALLDTTTGAPASQGTLAASPDFQAVLDRVGRPGLAALAYGNVPAALQSLARDWRGDGRRIANAMGLDTLKAVAYGLSFAGEGYRDTLVLHAPGADHGLVPMMHLPALDRPRLLGLVPANAFAFSESNMALDSLLAGVRKMAASVDDEAGAKMDEALAKVTRMLGVDLEKEVLPGLGGTLGWYASLPQGGGLYPELAFLATVKDPAAFEGVLVKLMEGIAGGINERGRVIAGSRVLEVEGQRLHLLTLQRAEGQGVVPFTPSWTLLGNRLVVTLVPYTLKEIVWRAQHPDQAGPGLEAQEDFRSLWAEKPASAGACSYFDLQAVMSLLYDTAVPLLQTAAKPNVMGELGAKLPLDWAALPPARVVRPYFRSLMGFESWGPDGIEMRLNAPIPMLAVAATAGAAGALFALRMRSARMGARAMPVDVPEPDAPRVVPVPEEGAEAKARRDLDELMRYVRLFALEQNALPASLEDLVREQFVETLARDPWDHAYRLVVVDAKTRAFRVVSDGPDGVAGTPDDVAVASR